MKIERLIQIFEQLLPIYEKAYARKYSYKELSENNLHWGICSAANRNYITKNYSELSQVFNNYYENIVEDEFLFPTPENWQDLKPRIDFMKSEIKELKRLLKKGYTHV